MKTLGEIIEDCKSGKIPTSEEMRYAICAMDSLMTFDHTAMMRLADKEKEGKPKILTGSAVFVYKEMWNRIKLAFEKDPKNWLGKNNDPDCPVVQKRRAESKRMIEKIINKQRQ